MLLIIDELLAKVVERVERFTDGRRVPVDGAGHADLAADDDGDAASVAPAITLFQIYDSDPPEVAARIADGVEARRHPPACRLGAYRSVRSILERVRVPRRLHRSLSAPRGLSSIGLEPAHYTRIQRRSRRRPSGWRGE